MRVAPRVPDALEIVAQRLTALLEPDVDPVLRIETITPVITILQRVAADWDTYVSRCLAEIDELREELAWIAGVAPTGLAGSICACVQSCDELDGRTPVGLLDQAADRLQETLIAAQDWLESAAAAEHVELRNVIRQHQATRATTNVPPPRALPRLDLD